MEVEGITLSCKELVELVTDYLEGALPPEKRARFQQHLLICRACRGYLDQMRATIRVAGTLDEDQVSPEALSVLQSAFAGWKAKK